MGSFDWDLRGGLLDLDPSALAVLGLRPEEYDGRAVSATRLIPAEEAARLRARARQVLKQGLDGFGAYYRTRGQDGVLRTLHSQAQIRFDDKGRPARIVGVVRAADTVAERATIGRDRAGVTERLTSLMEQAVSVDDVTAALNDAEVLGSLGAMGVMLGMVGGGRMHLLVHPGLDLVLPVQERSRLDEPLPMAATVVTGTPRFVGAPSEFRRRYPTMWPGVDPFPLGAGAYLPLVVESRCIGVLGVLFPEPHVFPQEERDLLVTLAGGIAQGLQRAMLHGQEHDLAESLQRAMLPRVIPAVPGATIAVRYRSARLGRNVGGDWYDVIELPGAVGVTVGDVQGHDTEAAAVMGQLRMALSAYVAEGHPPATALARTSTFLRELDTDRFATCTYVKCDLASGELRIVRAGHLDVLVRRRDGACRWIDSAGGLPLGLSAEFSGSGAIYHPVTRAVLAPGETMLLCTDGLVELPGTDLGSRMCALSDAMAAGPAEVEPLADHLLDMAAAQKGGDDMALLLLRRDA
ncbi:SpoIIE family protein phosphatase [Streptomyces montanisoli]|uniref:SpoIIE family protein phosphatase n=1 Tax=Streptomyces montanisoli TaxID=2798581 RepID=A0A940MF73_9ACTN|nr:SpoIIE family protein phosphatase [Streptomyces montanisoli]MBP0458026.1 SpoIIE family protein phosphatase [Streptomyces montanisoli]